METIEQIDEVITWLGQNEKSSNLVELCRKIDKLAVLSVSIAHDVSTAYGVMNELEDEYKIAFARGISSSRDSVAKAERHMEAELSEEKKLYTRARNNYKKLDMYLDRIDRVIESYRQLVSVSKMDLKHG